MLGFVEDDFVRRLDLLPCLTGRVKESRECNYSACGKTTGRVEFTPRRLPEFSTRLVIRTIINGQWHAPGVVTSGLDNLSINFFMGKFFFSQKRNRDRCKTRYGKKKRMQRDHKELSFQLSLPKVLSPCPSESESTETVVFVSGSLISVGRGRGNEQEAENETKAKDGKLTWCRAVPFSLMQMEQQNSLSLRIVEAAGQAPEEKRPAISPELTPSCSPSRH
jgi:hypothetical protein